MGLAGLLLAVALATCVEAVEALTIVLAIGVTRGWRAAWQGVAVGLVVLGVVVAVLGPAIAHIPLGPLRLVVGGLLLIFGLQWLRKAILRASGFKALHDEEAAYSAEVAQAGNAPQSSRYAVRDWYAFTVVTKAVVLEGLEVAFIVVTFGANAGKIGAATLAALVAIIVVCAAGAAVRAPLARVPENALKFVVGSMLTTFGLFWAGEGAGVKWPGGDLAIVGLLALTVLAALGAVSVLRRQADVATTESIA